MEEQDRRDVASALRMFDDLQDLVVAFDESLTITYVNRFARRLLRHEDTVLDGQTLTEFLHPDDLGRAAEIAGLIADDRVLVDLTPAEYRLRTRLDEWVTVEIMGTPTLDFAPLTGQIVIVGRYSGDNVIRDRILTQLTAGVALDEIVTGIPEFGLWRHAEDQYAVTYTAADGTRRTVGSDGAVDLVARFPGPDTPWAQAEATGREARHTAAELPTDLAAAGVELGVAACMVLPVADPRDGRHALAIGWSSRPNQDIGAHRYALERMAQSLEILLLWRSHTDALERAARYDSLSGLANRATFFDQLASTGVPAVGHAVLYVDLDRFKDVNDTHGHAAGDAVIVEAAARLAAAVRTGDLVARLGGDEFAVLARDLVDPAELEALAERIVVSLGQPIHAGGREIEIGASVGAVLVGPGQVVDSTMLAAADDALYDAKTSGRGRWVIGQVR